MSGQDDLPMPQLGLSEAEAASRFERLQRKLVPLWQSIRELNQNEQTIVVIPSQSIEFDCKGAEMQAYEERFLFLLLLLRQPRARLVYVTSQTILLTTIDYYLGLLRRDREPYPYAIEVNLRKGGTTHPFLTLQFLTDGSYDEERAVFVAPSGREKCFVATDHLESALFRAFTPDDLFDIVIRHGLHFDQTRQVGIVFHMLATLAENGRIGATAVGNSPEDADRRLARLQAALEDEARRALEPRELPDGPVAAAAGRGNRTVDQKSA